MWSPSLRSNRSLTASATIQKTRYAVPAEALLVDRAQLLTLTAPRDDCARWWVARAQRQCGQSKYGVFTHHAGKR